MKRSDLSEAMRSGLVPVEGRSGAYALVPPAPPQSVNTGLINGQLVRAHEALAAMDATLKLLPNAALVTRTLARREAVRSSQMEGTNTEFDELLQYEAARDAQGLPADVRVTHNYVLALEHGLEHVNGTTSFTSDLVKHLHQILMAGVEDYRDEPGEFRTIQNWIGGRSIYEARLVPPPASHVPELMNGLLAYLRDQDTDTPTSIIVRIAIAHAHFEAIHPFRDGNGRVGRLLMPLMLAGEGHSPVYVGGFLKGRQREYYDALLAAQTRGDYVGWIDLLAKGVEVSCIDAIAVSKQLLALRENWAARLKGLRVDSAAHRVADHLIGYPSVTVRSLEAALEISFPTANAAVAELVKVGILEAVTRGARNRVFAAAEVIAVLDQPIEPEPEDAHDSGFKP